MSWFKKSVVLNRFTKKKIEITKLATIIRADGISKLNKIYRFNTIEKPTIYMASISNLLAILIGLFKLVKHYWEAYCHFRNTYLAKSILSFA